MTLLFDKARSIGSPALAPTSLRDHRLSGGGTVLEIGLVNNMPDAALQATERQFTRLLKAGAGHNHVRLHCFALPSVPRAAAARVRIDSLYTDITDLGRIELDGLIVTGAEPRAATLPDEPYWRELTELVDWAEANTRSTIWSCLAAHAAVLHLDGIERRRLDQKCSGIFVNQRLHDDALLTDLPPSLQVAHSRLNDLAAVDLSARGYRVLTQSPLAGVDIFVRRRRSQFVFFQGHPEYDAMTLQREYLRDLGRYFGGERDDFPEAPAHYFDAATEAGLESFRARAVVGREPALMAQLPRLGLRPGVAAETEAAAATIFRNWLTALSCPR
jgi:homoserine O-succinyltransferase